MSKKSGDRSSKSKHKCSSGKGEDNLQNIAPLSCPDSSNISIFDNIELEVDPDEKHNIVTTPIPVTALPPTNDDTNVNLANKKEETKTSSQSKKKIPSINQSDYFANENKQNNHVSINKVQEYKYLVSRVNSKKFDNIDCEEEEKESYVKRNMQSPLKGQKNVTTCINTSIVLKCQENALEQNIFTQEHLTQYCSIVNQTMSKGLIQPMKCQFIQNLIIDYDLRDNVLKYDEGEKKFYVLCTEDIYKYLEEKFAKKTLKSRKKPMNMKKRSERTQTVTSTLQNNHVLHGQLKFGQTFYTEPNDQDEWFKNVMKGSQNNESEQKNLKNYSLDQYMEETSHSVYSVIHPIFDEYEFIVYNGSHRLAYPQSSSEPTCVHACSRLRFKFPAPSQTTKFKSFFIIFDSKLVHGGSRAYRESPLSSHHRFNYRLFMYAMQSYQGTRSKLSSKINEKDPEAVHVVNSYTNQGNVDHTTFEICDPYECSTCKNIKNKEITIDIEQEYKATLTVAKSKRKPDLQNFQRPESYVCGDLDIHGWEVHEGVDYMNDTQTFKLLKIHLEALYYGPKKQWNEITGNKGRSYLKLTGLIDTRGHQQFQMSRHYLVNVFQTKLSKIVEKIRGFHEHETNGNILLVNRGICTEQNPHRDYVSRTKDELKVSGRASKRALAATNPNTNKGSCRKSTRTA